MKTLSTIFIVFLMLTTSSIAFDHKGDTDYVPVQEKAQAADRVDEGDTTLVEDGLVGSYKLSEDEQIEVIMQAMEQQSSQQ